MVDLPDPLARPSLIAMDWFSATGNTASIVGLCVSTYAWWRVRAVRKAFQVEIGMNRLREKLSREERVLKRMQAQRPERAVYALGEGKLVLAKVTMHAESLSGLVPEEHRAAFIGRTTRLRRLADARYFEFTQLADAWRQTAELIVALENVMEERRHA